MKIRLFAFMSLIVSISNLNAQQTAKTESTYYSPGGTYSDWFFPKEELYKSLEWTFIPVVDPPESLAKEGLLHYYAYNFALVNSSGGVGGGYAGFQTNGIFKDEQKGKVVNFSIWGSNGGKTKGWLNAGNEESGGFQIMYPFQWIVGHPYRFQLKEGPSGTDSLGKWWGLWVTDQKAKQTTFLGEQRVPSVIKGKPSIYWSAHTSMFGEDLHWWKSFTGIVKYTDCASFQGSSMAATDITANEKIHPIKFSYYTNSGKPVKADNGFESVNCNVTIYADSTQKNVQHNLGYWAKPAPNKVHTSK